MRITRIFGRLNPTDKLTLGYIAFFAVLILLFHHRIDYWYVYVTVHAAALLLLIEFIRWADDSTVKSVQFLRDIYPVVLFMFMFKEVSLIINIFLPFWLESHLIRWDAALFGGHPTVLLQQYFRPWLTEFMAFSYWSYYVFLPLPGILFSLRKERAIFQSYVFNLSFTMYVCYFSYLLLTARGPQHTLSHLFVSREAAGLFDAIILNMQAAGKISGAAFPSSHVAAVWVALIYIFKFSKKLGWICLPIVLALMLSTVYLQYHYAVDAVAGFLLMCLLLPLSRRLEERMKVSGTKRRA